MGEGGIKPVDHIKAMEKLTRWGWAATIVWALLGLLLLAGFHPKETWSEIKFNEIGDFSAGFFAPLGFLWFVIALFHQRRQIAMQAEELSLQREELKETRRTLEAQRDEMAEAARQAKGQTESLQRSENISKVDNYVRMLEIFESDFLNDLRQIYHMFVNSIELPSFNKAIEIGNNNILYFIIIKYFESDIRSVDVPSTNIHVSKIKNNEIVQSITKIYITRFDILHNAAAQLNDDHRFLYLLEESMCATVYAYFCYLNGLDIKFHERKTDALDAVKERVFLATGVTI